MGHRSSGTRRSNRVLEDPALRVLIWLSWPVILTQFVSVTYSVVDSIWLGRIGKASFNAPIVSWPLISVFLVTCTSFVSSGIAVLSQLYGSGDLGRFEKSVGGLLFFAVTIVFLVCVPAVVLSHNILYFIGLPVDTEVKAVLYYRIVLFGIPFATMFTFFSTVANAMGDTRTPTKLSILSSVINMLLDPILIFGLFGIPQMGAMGAAIATVASETVIGIIGLIMLARGFRGVKLRTEHVRYDSWLFRKLFRIGAPIVLQRVSNYIGATTMIGIVSRFGSAVIAAYGVSLRITEIVRAFMYGVSNATAIMVGQSLGANKLDRARETAKVSITFTFLTLLAIATVIFCFAPQIVKVFVNDSTVIREGERALRVFSPSIPFFGLFVVMGGIASGSGHTMPYALTGVIRLWLLRVALALLLALYTSLREDGLWIAISLSNIIAGITGLIWIYSWRWAKSIV